MATANLCYEDFLQSVDTDQQGFAAQIHEMMQQGNCKLTIKPAASGPVASYAHPASKRVIINFVFRKGGLVIRVYGDRHNNYLGLLQTLPPGMVKAIAKAPVCKRLAHTGECNSRCNMGYDFVIRGEHYQKCRYNCFMFAVNEENFPFIRELVAQELRARGQEGGNVIFV